MQAGSYSLESQVRNTFNFMKSGSTYRETMEKSFELLDNDGSVLGYALPIGKYFEGL